MNKIVLTVLFITLTATQLWANVIVERTSADGIDLSFDLRNKSEFKKLAVNSKKLDKLVIKEDDFTVLGEFPEKEYLRGTYLIAVPEKSFPRLEITSISSREINPDNLISAQKLHSSPDGISYYGYSLATKTVLPSVKPAELVDMGYSDGNRIYAIYFHPLYFTADKAQLADAMQIRVNFGTSFSKSPASKKLNIDNRLLNSQFAASNKSFKQIKSSSFLQDVKTTWVRIGITEEGIYKISGSQIAALGGIDIGKIAVNKLAVYSSSTNPLSDDPNSTMFHGAKPTARKVIDLDNDGRFDAEDYVLFYGRPPVSWSRTGTVSHYYSEYSSTSYYWINPGIDGNANDVVEMEPLHNPSNNSEEITSFKRYMVKDSRKQPYYDGDGKKFLWFGANISANSSYLMDIPLDSYQDSAVCKINYSEIVGTTTNVSYFVNNQPVIVFNNTNSSSSTSVSVKIPASILNPNDNNSLRLTNTYNSGSKPFLNMELFYNGKIVASPTQNKSFFVKLGVNNSTKNYTLKLDQSAGKELFDITDPLKVKYSMLAENSCAVQIKKEDNYFYYLNCASYLAPAELSVYDNRSKVTLHELINNYNSNIDLLVVSPDEFYDYLKEDQGDLFKTHQLTDTAFKKAEVVKLSDINNEFGQGYQEPAATRNFIKYFCNTMSASGRKLKNVLLVGDGNNDYQNFLGYKSVNYIYPSSPANGEHTGSDDYYAAINSAISASVDVGIGRFPVMNFKELRTVIEKTNEFMLNKNPGIAGQTALFLGDDEVVRENSSMSHDQTVHIDLIESLLIPQLPQSIVQKKVYLTEYAETTDPATSTIIKPGAGQALVRFLNQGVKLFAYSGHGRPDKLAHEKAFAPDIWSSVSNRSYYLMMGATCSFGVFDTYDARGLAEIMFVEPKRGAIGTINSTRPCYAEANMRLFEDIFKFMFTGNYTIGEALMLAKKKPLNINKNSAGYMLMGDPALKIFRAKEIVSAPDSLVLTTLKKDSILSRVINQNTLNGKMLTAIYDAEKKVTYQRIYDQNTSSPDTIIMNYKLPGNLILPANSQIVNGNSITRFILPKDLNYGNTGAKVVFYGYNDKYEQVSGKVTKVSIAGGQSGNDTNPPELSIKFNGLDYQVGDPIGCDPIIYAIMKDENGINLSGGIGHKLLFELDGNVIEVGNYFNYFDNSYQDGFAAYQYIGLAEGKHTIKVTAWDTYNNYSSKTLDFEIVSSAKPSENWLGNLLNYPNPIKNNGTTFTFNLNRPVDVENYKITVYTINGRKLKIIDNGALNQGSQVQQAKWDGRDADGDYPANGVYFYKVDVKYNYKDEYNQSHNKTVTKIGKLLFAR